MKKHVMHVLGTAMLTGILTAGLSMPQWASAAEMTTSELRIKTGSTGAYINGNKQTIIKPYQTNGVTMVPVGIFKKAFGSEIRLE
ncbi:hypothetical protein BZG17_30090, partial [Escherichia coli]|nr:hypothetical protein [Escherichia coli]